METKFNIEPIRNEIYDYFVLRGNIDIHAEIHMKALPDQVSKEKIRLDFSEVGRVNSMGIGLLLRCLKRIRDEKKAEIVLTGLNTMHTMLFKTTGVFLLAGHEK